MSRNETQGSVMLRFNVLFLSSLFAAATPYCTGCAGSDESAETAPALKTLEANKRQALALKLEWEIAKCRGQSNRIAMAPVVGAPRPTEVFDSTNDLISGGKDTVMTRAPEPRKIYPNWDYGGPLRRLDELHKYWDRLKKDYEAAVADLKRHGQEVVTLPACPSCNNGLTSGAHYTYGRKDDGELGLIFESGGVHACSKCQATGVEPKDYLQRLDALDLAKLKP